MTTRVEWQSLDEDLRQTVLALLVTFLDGREMESAGKDQKDEAGKALLRLFRDESALAEAGVVVPDPEGTERTYTLGVQTSSARLNEEKLVELLLERGVDPDVVAGAVKDAKTGGGTGFMGVREGRGKS